MTLVRIAIKKSLTDNSYSYLQPETKFFSSEYLVRTDAPFLSPLLAEYARNLATAESRVYLSCIRFESAVVKLATLGAKPEELRGRFSHVSFSEIRGQREWKPQGQVVMGEGDTLAYPPVTAVYVRQAEQQRNGRLLVPHAVTIAEWNLYIQQRVLPLRFQRESALNQPPNLSFGQELIQAVSAANGTHVMPGKARDNEQSLRKVTDFVFDLFLASSSGRKRKKTSQSTRWFVKFCEEKGLEIPSHLRATKKRANSKRPTEGVVYLLQAGLYFKIGKSIGFEKRLAQIKLQLPYTVEVVHVIQAANISEVEAHWHRRFAALRQNGEWFMLTQAEVEEFKNVSTM